MTPVDMASLHARCFDAPAPWSAASFATLLNDPQVLLIDDPQARGFALLRVVLDEAELLTLAVDPTFRRLKIAHNLVGRIDTLAPERGAASIFLEVREDNLAARALYAACGYRQIGRRAGYYRAHNGARTAALILCKSLA